MEPTDGERDACDKEFEPRRAARDAAISLADSHGESKKPAV
jgi:hypothetical protein